MGERFSVVIAEPDQQLAAAARAAFAATGDMVVQSVVGDRQRLMGAIAALSPDVVIVDAVAVQSEFAEAIREITSAAPEGVVIVTAANASAVALSRAVVAGARGFVLKPYRPEELVETARDALLNARARRETQRTGADRERKDRGTILAVYSPKGGVGTSSVAANLAVALASRTRSPVGIVDLDLQFGDVGVLLDVKGPNSIIDLLDREDGLNETAISEVFVRHRSGVQALLAPDGLTAAESIDPMRVAKVLGQLRDHFGYVICDTWSTLDELSTAALVSADRVLLVVTPEVPALRNLQRVLNEVPSLRSESRCLLVLNRYPSRIGVDLREVERGLGRRVSLTIPSRGVEMGRVVNHGLASVGGGSDFILGQSFARLAALVMRDADGAIASTAVPASVVA